MVGEIIETLELAHRVLDYSMNFAGTVLVVTLDTEEAGNRFLVYVNEKGKKLISRT